MSAIIGVISGQNKTDNEKIFSYQVKTPDGETINAVSSSKKEQNEEVTIERKFYLFRFYQII